MAAVVGGACACEEAVTYARRFVRWQWTQTKKHPGSAAIGALIGLAIGVIWGQLK